MSVKMRVLCVLVLCLAAVCEAILASGRPAVNRETADQIVPQESNERSAFYPDYYPGEHDAPSEHGYYSEPPHHFYPTHDHRYGHDTALKALLLPLAGVALLGAAAVFASNPILLQLGVISGRRRRREASLQEDRLQDVIALERFVNRMPRDELAREERRLLATYLTCSGVHRSACLQRLACEVFQPGGSVGAAERRVVDIIIEEVIKNEFINEEMKTDIIKAKKAGQLGYHCERFPCRELDIYTKVEKKENEKTV